MRAARALGALLPAAALLLLSSGAVTHAAGAKKSAKANNAAKAKLAAKAKAAKQQALLLLLDPQTLVNLGKRPAFFDPSDLSKPPILSAPSALLMDADTGQVLWEKNARVRRAPASTTKILTGLLLIENTAPDDVLTCMDPAIPKLEGSSLHLKTWEKLTARDMLYGLMLRSANDGAAVIAQHVSGSIPKFGERMTQRARELGAVDSRFTNPNGLPDPNHYTTAYDLAVIARAALREPEFADAVGQPKRTIKRSKNTRDTTVATKGKKFLVKFPGADGVKTGYTRVAGHCFVGSATRGGRRLLSVVLGARHSAIEDTVPILSWGFQRFPAIVLARKGAVVGSVAVEGGSPGEVRAVAADDLHATTDRLSPAPPYVTSEIRPTPAAAPVAAGQEVGRLVAKVDGAEVASVPLLAAEPVERSAFALLLGGRRRSAAKAVTTVGDEPRRGSSSSSAWPWVGTAGLLALVGVRVATTASKSARRKRRRVPAARRSVHRLR